MSSPATEHNKMVSWKFMKLGAEFWVCLLLVVSTFLVYWPALFYPYISFDTPTYVFENFRVKQGLSIDNVKWALTTLHFSNWHPLTWLSYMLDVEIHGVSTSMFRLTNIVLHVINSVLLFLLLQRMTGKIGASGLVAGLFALHPLHIQSVVWIAERKDVLSTLFFFLSLHCYVDYVKRSSRFFYIFSLILFGLGLMAKPMLVTLPFVLLLLDYWPLHRFTTYQAFSTSYKQFILSLSQKLRKLLIEKTPFFLLSAASSMITIIAQKKGHALVYLDEIGLAERLANSLYSYVLYIYKAVWPVNLAIIYPHPGHLPWFVVLGSFVLLVTLSVLCVVRITALPFFAVGWFWYLGTLVPVIGLIQVGKQAMADRYTYIPLIGIFIIVSWLLHQVLEKWTKTERIYSFVAVTILLACMAASTHQLRYWKNGALLYLRAIEITQNNYLAHNNLGYEFQRVSHQVKALQQFERAISIKPDFWPAQANVGYIKVGKGDLDSGIEHYRTALEYKPDSPLLNYNLGVALMRKRLYPEAKYQFRRTIELNSNYHRAYKNLATILTLQGKHEEAERLRQQVPGKLKNRGSSVSAPSELPTN